MTSPQPSPYKRPSSSLSSSNLYALRGGATASPSSSSRTHLPHPRVLPFPDLPVRPMSREHSRISGSPFPSPAIDEGAVSAFNFGNDTGDAPVTAHLSPPTATPGLPASGSGPTPMLSPPNTPAPIQAAASTLTAPALPSASSLTFATSPPVPSPLGRPRASTTLPPRARQEGFIPTPNLRSAASVASVVSTPVTAQTTSTSGTSSLPLTAEVPTPPSATLTPTPCPPVPTRKPSNPAPTSSPITPSAPVQPLNDHLYQSFLNGTCADVRVIVRAWGAAWHLHRVVLVQAGFFHSLFLAGFSEAKRSKGKGRDDGWMGEDVELTFDDPNITRAAFEICLSRLYSSHPRLHFPSSLLPTPQQPLTPSLASIPDLLPVHLSLPPSTHLATPRLLLALIATATYLGVQPLLREAVAMVLRTVGPVTVTRYLGFATGDGIGEPEWEDQDDEGARGLEQVHRRINAYSTNGEPHTEPELSGDVSHSISTRASVDSSGASLSADDEVKCGVPAASVSGVSRSMSDASSRTLPRRSLADISVHSDAAPLPHFYGFVSNKIGEACVCWLSRWGADVLAAEVACATEADTKRGAHNVPAVWGAAGIPAVFARGVLSSDTLFVKGEMERYKLARSVLELRRKGWEEAREEGDEEGLWDEQEAEIERVFAEGVYYSHMTFEDLSTIAADIDPTTSHPYAPLHVLQAAHWAAADIKARVTSHPAESEATELGLTQTTSQIAALASRRRAPRSRIPSPPGNLHAPYASFNSLVTATPTLSSIFAPAAATFHPVPADDTHRIGAGGLVFLASPNGDVGLPGMPELGPDDRDADDTDRKRATAESEASWFGAKGASKNSGEIEATVARDGDKDDKWTKHEPFRFSVEFWGVDKLGEKDRLYSPTHFYAGSYFNVYVSTVRKKDKGLQLGIYLHRQSPKEPFPTPCARSSAPSPATRTTEPATLAPPSLYRALSTSPVSVGSPPTPSTPLPLPAADTAVAGGAGSERAPYFDPRRVTRAYFSISCASALGTARIRFSSAPDSFPLSHSWGWRSSALRSEEYLSVPVPAPGDDVLGWLGDGAVEGGSLRATVVVGII
ncbi:hypothetical protein Q5752_001888 [Cryptotrichosporon argae]